MPRIRFSRLPLILMLVSFALGWRSSTPSPEDLAYPINMTLADNRLFVSDRWTGLHVFDVSDPAAPKKLFRIPLAYNHGSAVKGDIVYTNHYRQLQAIRLTSGGYTVVAKIGQVYPDSPPWHEGAYSDGGFGCACSDDATFAPTGGLSGGSSSYATFAIVDDYLYRVYGDQLIVYDVSVPDKPGEIARQHIGWEIETVFPSQNFLFIGGTRGTFIFDRSDPEHPVQIARIEHARACDPVVVSGSTAYVTLRGSSWCGSAPDELLCVSVKDPSAPRIVGVKPLATPWGLATNGLRLYVSNGEHGYQLLDVSDPTQPAGIAGWGDWPTRDFIWAGNTLFVLGEDDVRIFDVSDPASPVLLSKIEPPAP